MFRKYFIYKGKLISLHDAHAVTKAFKMFLIDNNILDAFSTLLYNYSQRTVYEHVLLATPMGRRRLVNCFTWEGTFHGDAFYSALHERWVAITRIIANPNMILIYKRSGIKINIYEVAS